MSDLHQIKSQGLPFVFTDGHAYYAWANFYTDLADLNKIDWSILQARDFKRDPNDPAKFERYQAEALVHRHCPVSALKGMICYSEKTKQQLESSLQQRSLSMPVFARTGWYF